MAVAGSNDATDRDTLARLEQRVDALELRVRRAEAERDQLAREVDEARDARRAGEAAAHACDEILGVVAHDLRNPLATIAMAAAALAQLGEAGVPDGQRICTVADRIRRQATRMSQHIANLTDFAEIQGGRLTLDRAPHAPSAIIAAARALIEPSARERGVGFEAGAAPDLPAVSCDADRVSRALAALCTEAMLLSSGRDRIEIGARRGEDGVVEFFLRTQRPRDEAAPRARAAAGLAAAIARGIVEAHGGRLWTDGSLAPVTTVFSLSR